MDTLVCRVRRILAALPLSSVVETMRPLPVESLAGAPGFVLGVSIVRGAPTPVVDVGALLGVAEDRASTRFVTLRTGNRDVALAVEGVLGVVGLESSTLQQFPPLLGESSTEVASAIGTLCAELLVVLRAARVVPDSVWQALDAQESGSE